MDVPVKVDVKALEALQERLDKLSAGQKDQFFEAGAKDLVARFLHVVKPATPKISGTLRRGWTNGKDIGNSLSAELAFAQGLPVRKNGKTYTITVENNVEYAEYVEYGHRQQVGRYVPELGKRLVKPYIDPQYFVKRSQEALEPHIPRFLEKKLDQFLREAFDG